MSKLLDDIAVMERRCTATTGLRDDRAKLIAKIREIEKVGEAMHLQRFSLLAEGAKKRPALHIKAHAEWRELMEKGLED